MNLFSRGGPPIRDQLHHLIQNYYWAWDKPTQSLLERLPDYNGNPYATMAALSEERLRALDTPEYHQLIEAARESQRRYLSAAPAGRSVAYFCAEFGVDASLPIYAGGLGVLAGDHLKAASDAALPLVAVGLLYHGGYLRQSLDEGGWQHEEYPRLDTALTGLRLEQRPDGTPLVIEMPLDDRVLRAQVWRAGIGRVPLYLLDTDIDANEVASDREITQRLYGGDRDMRLRQEIVLGIGGVRALRALGYDALDTFHLNEGHAAFLLLELMREARSGGRSLDEVRAEVCRRAVFTTHTPVAAGHDKFAYDLLMYYLGPWWRNELNFSNEQLWSLGGGNGEFSMTELALNATRAANAVSAKHGEVTRAMFPGRAIGSITNGVHHTTWTGPHAAAVYDCALKGWREDGSRLRDVDPLAAEVRQAHDAAKRDLIAAVNARYPEAGLEESVFTIGFARRMTGYKRATLLFRDPARLAAIAERGLQVVVAGKAHPHDEEGKGKIAEIVRHMGDRPARIVFVDGYDMRLARLLVAGVDVWLNNPHRPMEASGTSGMKALLNGVPNLSVLDGWWVEGYSATNGWAIGEGFTDEDEDAYDANSLYELLERDVMPEYYERPDAWAARRCRAIATAPDFTAQRMVAQYASEVYGL